MKFQAQKTKDKIKVIGITDETSLE